MDSAMRGTGQFRAGDWIGRGRPNHTSIARTGLGRAFSPMYRAVAVMGRVE